MGWPGNAHTSSNTNGIVGKERNARDGEHVSIDDRHQTHEGVIAESERCDTYGRYTLRTLASSENIDAHKPGKPNDPDVCDENDNATTQKQIEAQKRYSGKPARNKRKVK